jgi:F0F1-type ATP synthase assembly protein I
VDLRSKRETYNGFGEALSRAFEFAVTPAIFGGIGWLIDDRAGTSPLFLLLLILFAFVGMFIRMWLGYDTEMRRHEANAPWAPKSPKAEGPK